MIKPVLLAASLFVTAAQAQEAGSSTTHLSYAGYSHGFNVIALEADLTVGPARYRLETNFSLAGVLGTLFHADGKTIVNGHFVGTRAVPDDYTYTGHFRGENRVAQLVWKAGVPTVVKMEPPVEDEREPVPVAQQANTIDSLSAMAALIHQIIVTGKCDGRDRTYDGRRLSEVSAHTVGQEALEETSRSSVAGTALRCDFQGKQLAGFRRDADQNELAKPTDGSAWFAQLSPGGPPIPVRVRFSTAQLGDITMYLTGKK